MKTLRLATLCTLLILSWTICAYGTDTDTGETPEIQFSSSDAQDLLTKATELGSPVKISEYVLNSTEYTLYHGSRSGSINSFLGQRGNDVDLASTLIAMLRSRGLHARYVVGNVRVATEKAMNWLGVKNADLAASIMKDQGIQNIVLSPDKTSLDFEHVWVEALVSYGNYRGAGQDASASCTVANDTCRWVSLDPSFKQKQYNSQSIDIYNSLQFDYTSYYNAIKNNDPKLRDKNPLVIYEEQILSYLKANNPGKTLEDVADAGTIIQQNNLILPASLPYVVIDTPRRYNSVADHDAVVGTVETKKWKKQVKITVDWTNGSGGITTGGGTVSLVDASTKRLTVTYDIKTSPQGFDRMVTRLGGVEIAVPLTAGSLTVNGQLVTTGFPFTIQLEMDGSPATTAGGTDNKITVTYPNCVVGGYYLIATGGETSNWSQVHRAADELLQANQQYKIINDAGGVPYVDTNGNGILDAGEPRLLDNRPAMDALTGGLLYVAGTQYYAKFREQIERADNLDKVKTPIEGFLGVVSSVYDVEYLNDTAFSIMPGGLLIDMKGIHINGLWRVDQAADFSNKHFELVGHIGSSLEHETWQELTGYDAISTVRGIQLAMANGATITNPKKNATEDTLPNIYGNYGYSNTAPTGFARNQYSLFGQNYLSWGYTGADPSASFIAFRPDTQGLSASDTRLGYWTYTANAGFDTFFKNYDSVENNLIAAKATEGLLKTNVTFPSTIANYQAMDVLSASVSSPAGFAVGSYTRSGAGTYNYIINETASHTNGIYSLVLNVELGDAVNEATYSISGFTGYTVLTAAVTSPAGFTVKSFAMNGTNVVNVTLKETTAHANGQYVVNLTFGLYAGGYTYASTATVNVKVTGGRWVDVSGTISIGSIDVSDNTSITCSGGTNGESVTYTGTPTALLVNLQSCFNNVIRLNNWSAAIAYFNPTALFELRSIPTADDSQFTSKIMGIRNDLYLRDTNQSWVEYLIPSKLTVGPYYRFEVDLRKAYDAPTGHMASATYGILNEAGVSAGGGYVDGTQVLTPAHSILTPSVTSILPTFNNAVFTDQNTISQVNNDVIKTPSTADPVSTVTGNNYHDETDFTIKGRGLNIAFTRTYNSAPSSTIQPGVLGYGWTHSYAMKLKSNDYGDCPNCGVGTGTGLRPENGNSKTSSITYTDERGGEHNYLVNETTFAVTAPKGEFDTLALNSPSAGYHTITFRNGVQYVFQGGSDINSIPGRTASLYQIKDAYGNSMTFSYTSGNLTGIADTLARSISIGYVSNRITSINDWSGRSWAYTYDGNGNLQSVTNPLNKMIQYTYHSGTHNLNEVILPETRDGKQIKTAFKYYQNGKTFNYSNSLGYTETLDYDLYRKSTRVTDPRGFIREYEYDANGLMTKLTEPDNAILQFENSDDGLRFKKYDGLGYATTYSYRSDRTFSGASDTSGNVTLEKDPLAYTLEYDYGLYDQVTRTKDKNGNTRTMAYYGATNPATDAVKGKLQSVTLGTLNGTANVLLQSYTYYPDGNIKQLTEYLDPATPTRKRITTYVWQDNGLNLQSVTVSGSGKTVQTSYTYDTLGRRKTATLTRRTSNSDPTLIALTTTYDYDTLDRVTKVTDVLGNSVETTYDGNGKVYQVKGNFKKPDNTFDTRIISTRTYDAADRLVSDIDTYGNITSYAYDKAGNLLTTTDANDHIMRYEYDAMNRRTAAIDANGNKATTIYDLAGHPIKVINALGKSVTTIYDANGRPTTVTDPLGYQTSFDYDANGNVKAITDANAMAGLQAKNSYNATIYKEYDELNRVKREVDALNGITAYTYDLLGNITSITDAENHVTTFIYNDLGQLTELRDPLIETPSDKVTSFTYDEAGNVLTRTKRSGTQTVYTYDQLNRLTQAQHGSIIETITYNIYGNKQSVSNPDVTYSYEYDNMNRPTKKTDSRVNKSLSYTYGKAGEALTKTNYDGTTTEYRYDSANKLVAERNADYLEVSYQYDGAGRLLSRILSNGARTEYNWDNANRLTSLVNRSADGTIINSTSYQRDRIGNITSQTDSTGTATFTYDATYRLVSADYPNTANDQSYTYDKVGNRKTMTTATGTLAYVYNTDNRLTEIRQGVETGPIQNSFDYDVDGNTTAKKNSAGTVIRSYAYDAKGRVTSTGSNTFSYDPYDYRVAKTDSQGSKTYLLEGEHLEAVMNGGNWQAKYLRGAVIDEIVNGYQFDANNVWTNYTYHHDALQSVIGLTGHEGSVLQATGYNAFGDKQWTAGASNNNRIGYTGREEDQDSGLMYYRARYYDPSIGRFISEDPKGFGAGVNFYAYVLNNPVNANDPMGLRSYGFGANGSLTAITGIEGAISIVWNTGSTKGEKSDLGIQFTLGATGGFNVGAAFGGMYYNGGIKASDGSAFNASGGAGIFGVSVNVDPKTGEITGGSLGIGPPTRVPFALSGGYDQTKTLSIREDLIPAIKSLFGGDSATPSGEPTLDLRTYIPGEGTSFNSGTAGGFVIYPKKVNSNMMGRVYSK